MLLVDDKLIKVILVVVLSLLHKIKKKRINIILIKRERCIILLINKVGIVLLIKE